MIFSRLKRLKSIQVKKYHLSRKLTVRESNPGLRKLKTGEEVHFKDELDLNAGKKG